MDGALKSLKAYLEGTRGPTVPELSRFPELNAERLIRELEVVESARTDGTNGLPPFEASGISETEHRILNQVGSRAHESEVDYHAALDLYQARIQASTLSDDGRVRVQAAGEDALIRFGAQVHENRSALHLKLNAVRNMEREYQRFRSDHGLVDFHPIVLSPTEFAWRWIFLAILFVAETIINGLFFSAGSTAGIIGGVTVAATLSFLNLGVAGLQGLVGLRYLHYRSQSTRALAAMGVLVLVAAAILVNLMIAHYRDLFVATEGHVLMADMKQRMQADVLGLDQWDSFVLLGLGLALHLLAVVDFYGMLDPYPGYTAIAKRHQQAFDAYADEKSIQIQSLTHFRDDAIDDMKSVIDELNFRVRDFRLAVQYRAQLHRQYLTQLEHLNSVAHRLIDLYRSHNRVARQNQTVPRYFGERPKCPVPASQPLPEVQGNSTQVHERAVKVMSQYIAKISEEYSAAVRTLISIEDLTTESSNAGS